MPSAIDTRTTTPASRERRLVPQSPLEASETALREDLAHAGLTRDDYNIIARSGAPGEIEVYLDADRFSALAPKVTAIFDAAGFGKIRLPDPYTGYDKTYRQDENGVVYSLVRDQKVSVARVGNIW